jgi:hypothetical protein
MCKIYYQVFPYALGLVKPTYTGKNLKWNILIYEFNLYFQNLPSIKHTTNNAMFLISILSYGK